jgi:hypothetical protein
MLTVSIVLPSGSSLFGGAGDSGDSFGSGSSGGGGSAIDGPDYGSGSGGRPDGAGVPAFGIGGPGWSCQPTTQGVTCTHDALVAGQRVQGAVFITSGSSACGQPVSLTVTSGTVIAQASQDIRC